MKYTVLNISSIVLTSLSYLLGGFDSALKCLIIVIIIDYLTGIISAIYNNTLNSKTGLKGILKKFCYLLIVTVAVVIDGITGETGIIRNLVIFFFVANDGISILENVGKMGIKYPEKLKEILEQLNEK